MKRPENRNILWAGVIVDELARAGIRHAVLAPGSRSTSLAVAFSRDDRFIIYSVIDERAAAFFGLGIGKTSGMPAVVVCTSGTAAANFFPAVVEAGMSDIPLILLTADRPHELRGSGANQTIDQVHLYGRCARWFVDVAPPHADPEPKTLRYLRTTVDRAVATACGAYLRDSGVRIGGGPVHLNVPFEKPLEPVEVEGDVPDGAELLGAGQGDAPAALGKIGVPQIKFSEYESIVDDFLASPHGVIICGAAAPPAVADALARLARATGYPMLAEGGARFHSDDDHILGGYETFLRADCAEQLRPQLIFQVGALPVGNALLTWLEKQTDALRIQLGAPNGWADESHLTTTFVQTDPVTLLLSLGRIRHKAGAADQWNVDPGWIKPWQAAERIAWEETDELTAREAVEASVLPDVVNAMDDGLLFIANSNPIRHFDQFVRPGRKPVRVEVNRGASGIDGTVASALGAACDVRGLTGPRVLVIGDLALYHDLNSLHLIRRLNIPLIVVCINNDGGGIFHRLPIAQYEPPFRDLFVTPHGLTFEHAAAMFGIPYTIADIGAPFRDAFAAALKTGGPALIEVPTDSAKFEAQRLALNAAVARRIGESGILDQLKTKQGNDS